MRKISVNVPVPDRPTTDKIIRWAIAAIPPVAAFTSLAIGMGVFLFMLIATGSEVTFVDVPIVVAGTWAMVSCAISGMALGQMLEEQLG